MQHRRRSLAAGWAAGLAVALVLVGCGADAEPDAAPVQPGPSSSVPESPAAKPTPTASEKAEPVVPAVLDFAGTTVAGDEFRGSSVAGKPVVLWFWAPWCAVCRSQVPEVKALASTYGDDLAVIGIGSLDSGNAIAGFANDVPGPVHLSDPDGDLWKRFRIAQQSSFVVLDATGREVLRTGYNDDDALTTTVEKLVG